LPVESAQRGTAGDRVSDKSIWNAGVLLNMVKKKVWSYKASRKAGSKKRKEYKKI